MESGPRLDRGLSCWEGVRRDSRRIQELWDEDTESREVSVLWAVDMSLGRMDECLRLADFEKLVCPLVIEG